MEETGDYSLCILCCYSFPLPSSLKNPHPPEKNETIFKFIQQTGVLDLGNLSFTGLLGSRQVSFCPECLSGVVKAVDKREQVEEMEVNVRRLQLEILRMMRQLRGLMDGYLEEMKGIEETIKQGDEGCLKGKLGMKKEGTWTDQNVFQFRNGILNVVQELKEFQSDVFSKVLMKTEDKAEFNHVECKVEFEAVPDEPDKLKETCDDQESEDDSDRDWENNEEDPIPPTSTKPKKKRPYNPVKKLCQFCNKTVVRFYDHQLYNCPNNPKRRPFEPCVCHRCGKSFDYKRSLQKHLIQTCLKEGNLKCGLCGKEGFKNRHHLAYHENGHSRLRPWVCALCRGDFKQRSHLRRHEKLCDGSKKPRRPRWSNMLPEIKKPGEDEGQNRGTGDKEDAQG